MAGWLDDLRSGLRALGRRRLLASTVIVSLGLALAGNATVFSLTSALLLRPFSYDTDGLVFLWQVRSNDGNQLGLVSPANFEDWRTRARVFDQLSAFRSEVLSLSEGDEPEPLVAASISVPLFDMLGVEPALGRLFLPEDGRPGAEPVIVLSHELWRDRYAASPDVLGRVLEINGGARTVIGVLPGDFWFLNPQVRAWLPLVLQASDYGGGRLPRQPGQLMVAGRLREDVSRELALQEMMRLSEELESEFPQANRGVRVRLLSPRDQFPGRDNMILLLIIQGALGFVLLIACGNVANLLLAQGQARSRELAVRAAVGASPGRLLRQLLSESLWLSVGGAILGLLLGVVGVRLLAAAFGPVLPPHIEPRVDGGVVLFGAILGLLSVLVFGAVPAWRGRRPDLVAGLREHAGTAGPGPRMFSRGLVVVEVALALALLTCAVLLVDSFVRLATVDEGFETEGLLAGFVSLPEDRYPDATRQLAFYDRLRPRLAVIPGVENVTLTNLMPRSLVSPLTALQIDGRPPLDDSALPSAIVVDVDQAYLETLGARLSQGRFLRAADRAPAAPVVVINRTLARRLFGAEMETDTPVGRRLGFEDRVWTIVGVVDDIQQAYALDPASPQQSVLYRHFSLRPQAAMSLLLRTNGAPESMAEEVRAVLQHLDRDLVSTQLVTFESILEQLNVAPRVLGALTSIFALLAVVLATIGLYGVLARSVARHRREIGVRMALGASRRGVVLAVVNQALVLTLAGVVLALPLVWWITGVLDSILAEIGGVRPLMALAACALVLIIAAIAGYLPARHAAKVDPAVVLKGE